MITLTHTHAEGTLAVGTSKENGSAQVLKASGWQWSRSLGMWFVRRSRDKDANMEKIQATRAALEAAGLEVSVEIDDTPRPVEQVEADRAERLENRAEGLQRKAERLHATADREWEAGRAATAGIPMGQPILVGHHSESRHRAALARSDRHDRKAIDAYKQADEAQQSAHTAQASVDTRYLPPAVAARINRLEEKERELVRRLDGSNHTFAGGYVEHYPPATGDRRIQLDRRLTEVRANLQYWREIRDQQQADGTAPVYSKATIAKGDKVRINGSWYEVKRANAKSVTVPSIVGGSWTDIVPYHKISGHQPAKPAE